MIGLYVFGIVMGILMALIFKKTAFKGEAVPFVMELPNYRLPGAKNVGHLLWDKAKDFLQRAFTVIFIATIVIWFLQNFDMGLNMVSDSQNSILALVAGVLAPIFLPVGFGDWRIVTALISGFMAKESVVSSLTVLFGSSAALQGTYSCRGSSTSRVLPTLYAMCCSNRICETGAGRKMGSSNGIRTVPDRMGCCIRCLSDCRAAVAVDCI